MSYNPSMELKQVISFYQKNVQRILLGSLVFLLVGVGVYFLPTKYIALGSFLVVRNIEPLETDFSYEGYYAQLTAQDFSRSLAVFFKNENILQEVSEDFDVDYRNLKRRVKISREGPNVFRLEVKHSSPDKAIEIWGSLKTQVNALVKKINQEADASLKVFVIGDEPLVREAYKNIYLYGLVGFSFGLLFMSFYLGLKEYLK